MKNILTYKKTMSNHSIKEIDVITEVIHDIEEQLRCLEEIKEFEYKGYDIEEFNNNCSFLKVKFLIQ